MSLVNDTFSNEGSYATPGTIEYDVFTELFVYNLLDQLYEGDIIDNIITKLTFKHSSLSKSDLENAVRKGLQEFQKGRNQLTSDITITPKQETERILTDAQEHKETNASHISTKLSYRIVKGFFYFWNTLKQNV